MGLAVKINARAFLFLNEADDCLALLVLLNVVLKYYIETIHSECRDGMGDGDENRVPTL